ncbi:MAG TPA: 30S ribosomal protein S3 [Candidatus Gastranaerophilales bacterium]|nr:30S ribosomal protein S3 [Candidatus Gastranaerophilales bacterium]
MGQKTHPTGFRLGVIKTWSSNWYATKKTYVELLDEDNKIRNFIKKKYNSAGISRILIDRKAQTIIISIIAAKPGIIVGRGGQGIETMRKELNMFSKKRVQINVLEVARVDIDAQLVSEFIAQQLEKRVAFRRAMKQAIQRAMRSGIQGIKVSVSGRLGGAEIARTEWAKEGRIPLQTLRADIDYGVARATTIMGIIGVKVWIFKNEILPGEKVDENIKSKTTPESATTEDAGARRGRARRPKAQ